jgi:hypothetical protein
MRTIDHVLSTPLALFVIGALVCFQPQFARCADWPLVRLADSAEEHLLGTNLQLLRDSSGNLTIQDVSSPAAERRFEPVVVRRPTLGYTRDAIWFRFRIRNDTEKPDWVLNVGREWIEDVTLPTKSATVLPRRRPSEKKDQGASTGSKL